MNTKKSILVLLLILAFAVPAYSEPANFDCYMDVKHSTKVHEKAYQRYVAGALEGLIVVFEGLPHIEQNKVGMLQTAYNIADSMLPDHHLRAKCLLKFQVDDMGNFVGKTLTGYIERYFTVDEDFYEKNVYLEKKHILFINSHVWATYDMHKKALDEGFKE